MCRSPKLGGKIQVMASNVDIGFCGASLISNRDIQYQPYTHPRKSTPPRMTEII